jgi:hypothetical protein
MIIHRQMEADELYMFGNKVLYNNWDLKTMTREKFSTGPSEVYIRGLYNLQKLLNIIKIMKPRRLRWAAQIAKMKKTIGTHSISVCKIHAEHQCRIQRLKPNMWFWFSGRGAHRVFQRFYKVFFIASGVGLSPLYCGHFWPIVPAPDDR